MFVGVTHSGTSSDEGTDTCVVGSTVVGVQQAWPAPSCRPGGTSRARPPPAPPVDRLVDRSALVAGEDVLETGQGRVLAGRRERLRLDAVGLQERDDRRAVLIVRDHRRVDAVMGGVGALELGQRDRRHPRPRGAGDERVLSGLEVGREDAVVALRKQRGVVVGHGACHHDDVRLGHVPRIDALHETRADQLTDVHVVEADVVSRARRRAEGEPVIVDDRDAVRLGIALHRHAGARILRVDQQNRRTVGDRALGVGHERRVAAQRVLDGHVATRQTRGRRRLLQIGRVELDVPRRAGRVRQDRRDLTLALRRQRSQRIHRGEIVGERCHRDARRRRSSRSRGSRRTGGAR